MNPANSISLQPDQAPKHLLLHCCCAPCSGGIIKTLSDAGIEITVLFYNPNIHPQEEYELRKDHLTRYLNRLHIHFVDSDYNSEAWFKQTAGLENEPQRGRRCRICFEHRLNYSAEYAREHGFPVFTSSFGISRWKDMDQVNSAGKKAAEQHGVYYWDHNWRKKGGSQLMSEIARQENFYRQKYCGCRYSM
ncbi:MAG: epoxyqueuosine reductase QueH [Candidatus Omnitrophota bacterium]